MRVERDSRGKRRIENEKSCERLLKESMKRAGNETAETEKPPNILVVMDTSTCGVGEKENYATDNEGETRNRFDRTKLVQQRSEAYVIWFGTLYLSPSYRCPLEHCSG